VIVFAGHLLSGKPLFCIEVVAKVFCRLGDAALTQPALLLLQHPLYWQGPCVPRQVYMSRFEYHAAWFYVV